MSAATASQVVEQARSVASSGVDAIFPRIAVGSRYQKGVDRFEFDLPGPGGKPPQRFEVVPWSRAFHEPWSYDAHFVTYDIAPTNNDVPPLEDFPRLRKNAPVVDELRAAGYEVFQWGIGLDYDTPGHQPWNPGEVDDFKALVEAAGRTTKLISEWNLFYTTGKGARFVYVLEHPSPVGNESEAIGKALVRTWGNAGIRLDPECKDWTRLFRLPCVERER